MWLLSKPQLKEIWPLEVIGIIIEWFEQDKIHHQSWFHLGAVPASLAIETFESMKWLESGASLAVALVTGISHLHMAASYFTKLTFIKWIFVLVAREVWWFFFTCILAAPLQSHVRASKRCLCACIARLYPKITGRTLKLNRCAEAFVTLPSLKGQINTSAWLSFLELFLESLYSGIPHDQMWFPACFFSAPPCPFVPTLAGCIWRAVASTVLQGPGIHLWGFG